MPALQVVGPCRLAGVHVLLDVEHLRAAVAVDHPHFGECDIVADGAEAQGFIAALVRADVQDVAIGMAVDGLLAELTHSRACAGRLSAAVMMTPAKPARRDLLIMLHLSGSG